MRPGRSLAAGHIRAQRASAVGTAGPPPPLREVTVGGGRGTGREEAATHRIVLAEPLPVTPLPNGVRAARPWVLQAAMPGGCGAAQSAARCGGTHRLALGSGNAAIA